MRGPAVKPVVIAAGGTGGHFFPAEALAATKKPPIVRRMTADRPVGASTATMAVGKSKSTAKSTSEVTMILLFEGKGCCIGMGDSDMGQHLLCRGLAIVRGAF